MYCKDPAMARMLRCLFFLEAKFDFTLSAVHVSGSEQSSVESIEARPTENRASFSRQTWKSLKYLFDSLCHSKQIHTVTILALA